MLRIVRIAPSLVFLAALLACSGPTAEQAPSVSAPATAELEASPVPEERSIRVLFIGNSYTFSHRLPQVLMQVAEAAGGEPGIHASMLAYPDWTLKQHWDDRGALAEIRRGSWDFVVLQGHSMSTLQRRERLHEYARRFDSAIRESGARTVFFMTWARRGRPEMLATVREGYGSIAAELDAVLVPVGSAWQLAHERHPGIHLWHVDGSHPSPAGTYLAAAMFYGVLTDGGSAVGADHEGFGYLDTAEIRALQEVAAELVVGASSGQEEDRDPADGDERAADGP